MSNNIHSTAIISSTAKIADSVKIGAYAIIEDDVIIGENSVIESHAKICSGSRIDEFCKICSFCTIAGLPQDLHFDESIISYVFIGNNTVVREGSTIHRATLANGRTSIGKNCYIMANSHIAHDVIVGDGTITAPFCAVGGFAQVGENAFVSGGVMLHQKIRVGKEVMLSGNGRFSQDIPPFVIGSERNFVSGLNIVGLSRRKHSRDSIANLKQLYALVYSEGNPKANAKKALDANLAVTLEGVEFLNFFVESEGRHFCRPEK